MKGFESSFGQFAFLNSISHSTTRFLTVSAIPKSTVVGKFSDVYKTLLDISA
jgi:hypothetical protein